MEWCQFECCYAGCLALDAKGDVYAWMGVSANTGFGGGQVQVIKDKTPTKVQGLEGLYVADASIMPEIVSCNTNLTSIMIGERIGEGLVGAG